AGMIDTAGEVEVPRRGGVADHRESGGERVLDDVRLLGDDHAGAVAGGAVEAEGIAPAAGMSPGNAEAVCLEIVGGELDGAVEVADGLAGNLHGAGVRDSRRRLHGVAGTAVAVTVAVG